MITVADLKNQTGTHDPHPVLYCRDCGAEYSANKGDYFMHPPTYPFFCCDQPMILVVKKTVFEEVEP
jgi:hypothetical protein